MSNKHDDDCGGKDMLVPGPVLDDRGARLFKRHRPDHSIVEGVMRPVKEGEALLPGVFALTPRDDGTQICDVEDIPIPHPACYAHTEEGHEGPARVSTPAYRENWDRIFGGKTEVGQA